MTEIESKVVWLAALSRSAPVERECAALETASPQEGTRLRTYLGGDRMTPRRPPEGKSLARPYLTERSRKRRGERGLMDGW